MISVIGVDPGPTTGIAVLHWSHPSGRDKPVIDWHGYQCDAGSAVELLVMLLRDGNGEWDGGEIEHFVHGNLPNSPTTVQLEDELAEAAQECGVHLVRRPMAAVKPWASDKRMTTGRAWAAIPAKMVDGRAAGRHALFCAVHDARIPDPLSKAGRPAA